MTYFIIIRGPAAVGKSVVAKIIAKKLNAQYISFDDVMKNNKLDIIERDGISTENFIKANNLVIPEAKKILKKGQIIVFDGCFYRAAQIKHLKQNLKFKSFIFKLEAPLNECLKRNKNRKNKLSDGAVKDVYALVSKLNTGIKIQTSKKSVREVVDETIRKTKTSVLLDD